MSDTTLETYVHVTLNAAFLDAQYALINNTNSSLTASLQNTFNLAKLKFDNGLIALASAQKVKTEQNAVDLANIAAGVANTTANAAKVLFDNALAAYNTSPTDENKVIKDNASANYDAKLELAVKAAANASTLTNVLKESINKANADALLIGYNYPIASPTDQEILETLTQLITDGCIDVSEIQQKITEIITTSNTFNTFIEKMSTFNDYEAILEVRLKQIFKFLSEDGIIDAQEEIITNLRFQIINAINVYKMSVMNNNTLATQVNTLYSSVDKRLDNLYLISTEVGHTMQDVEKLITLKRGGQTFAKKVIFVPIFPTTYTKDPNSRFGLTTTNLIPITATKYQMRYNFMYDSAGSIITCANDVFVDVKLEVMSTSHNTYDTTSKCVCCIERLDQFKRTYIISCVASSGRISFISTEKMYFYLSDSPTIPLKINQGMITISIVS